jgi:hypothetical protein
MAEPINIREGSVTSYSDQTLLKTKHNACGTRSEGDAQRTATAEWANLVDTAAKQCNEAFNGLPVNASNVRGAIKAVTTGSTAQGPGSAVEVVLLTNGLDDGDWVYMEGRAFGYDKANNYIGIINHSAVFRLQSSVFIELTSWNSTIIYQTSPAEDETFDLKKSSSGDPIGDSIVASLGLSSSRALDWIIEFNVRVVPGENLQLPDILPDHSS